MTRQVSAREAQLNYIMSSKDVLQIKAEKAAKAEMQEIIKLVKAITKRGHKFNSAAKIAKRAYKLGVRA